MCHMIRIVIIINDIKSFMTQQIVFDGKIMNNYIEIMSEKRMVLYWIHFKLL